jgi:hypothetical protein
VKRIKATGHWSFEIDPEFEVRENEDSVQANAGGRCVYVSSMIVGTAGNPVPAADLRKAAARKLTSGRISHVAEKIQGDAEFRVEGETRWLFGVMCANGTVATCVIDFADPGDAAWAESVWRSLRCDEAG